MITEKVFEEFWKTFNPSFGVEKHDGYEIWKASAEQARKEAAEIVTEYLFRKGIFKRTNGKAVDELRAAILADSTTVSTDAEKLAIAVKALEDIKAHDVNNGSLYCLVVATTALKEIQK